MKEPLFAAQSLQFGLIGYPLTHSFSPGFFGKKFEELGIAHRATYRLFPLQNIEQFNGLIAQNPQLQGLNVTIPYKQLVIPFLDHLSDEARQIGAVNTIAFLPDGKTCGYNTDAWGFEQSLLPLLQPTHHRALVLGWGGAAKAVAYVLNKLRLPYTVVARTPQSGQLTYAALNEEVMQQHTLIINTTPLGMYPHTQQCPALPYHLATNRHLFYDLIYNPAQTLFLQNAAQHGATVKNGLQMLHLQAEQAWHIWTSANF